MKQRSFWYAFDVCMAPVLTLLLVAVLVKLQPDMLPGRMGILFVSHNEYQAFMGTRLSVHKTLKPKNTE
jgi:hypothetical protein